MAAQDVLPSSFANTEEVIRRTRDLDPAAVKTDEQPKTTGGPATPPSPESDADRSSRVWQDFVDKGE